MAGTGKGFNDYGYRSDFKRINRNMSFLAGLVVMVFLTGWLTWGERFSFWENAYSHLGVLRTPGGNSNTVSFSIYLAGMVLCSLLCLHTSFMFVSRTDRYLFRLCAAGFILLSFPCDLFNPVHILGGILVFGSLWFFTLEHLIRLFYHLGRVRFFLYQVILNGTVMTYAFLFAMGSPHKQPAQKFALAGLIVVLKLVSVEKMRVSRDERFHTG